MIKKIAGASALLMLLSVPAQAANFMDAAWATQACAAWNADSTLTSGLMDTDGYSWAKNDGGRGYKLVQMYRTQCGDATKIQLNIVVKDGKTWLVTGSPGGSRIITTVLQMVVNSIDFGMNVAEATNAPRFHHQWLPDELRVEKGFSPDTLKLLEQRGQKVAVKEAMGSTQSIMVGPDGALFGASDPRSVDDLSAGY